MGQGDPPFHHAHQFRKQWLLALHHCPFNHSLPSFISIKRALILTATAEIPKNEAFQIIPNRPENACGKTRQSFQSTAVIVEASVRCSLSGMRRTSKSHNHHQNPTCPRIYVLFTCCLYSRNEIPCPVNIINTYIIYESVYNYYILLLQYRKGVYIQ